jgi:hypothetical protein
MKITKAKFLSLCSRAYEQAKLAETKTCTCYSYVDQTCQYCKCMTKADRLMRQAISKTNIEV